MFREGPSGFKGGLSAEKYISLTGISRATANDIYLGATNPSCKALLKNFMATFLNSNTSIVNG